MKYDFTTNEYELTRVDGSKYRWDDLFPAIVHQFWTNPPEEWDLENKITWDEIAPSLQELIIRKIKFSDLDSVLQNRIITDEANIRKNTNAINQEIADRKHADKLLQDQIDDIKRRITVIEKRLTDLELRMNEAERQIGLLWEQVRRIWEQIEDLWLQILLLWEEIDNLYNYIEEIMKLLQTIIDEIQIIWEEIGLIWENIQHIWDLLRQHEERIDELEKRMNKAEEQINELWARLVSITSELELIWKELQKLWMDIDNIYVLLKDLYDYIDKIYTQINKMCTMINNLIEEVKKLQTEVQLIWDELNKVWITLQDVYTNLDRHERKIKIIENDIDNIETDMGEVNDEMKKIKELLKDGVGGGLPADVVLPINSIIAEDCRAWEEQKGHALSVGYSQSLFPDNSPIPTLDDRIAGNEFVPEVGDSSNPLFKGDTKNARYKYRIINIIALETITKSHYKDILCEVSTEIKLYWRSCDLEDYADYYGKNESSFFFCVDMTPVGIEYDSVNEVFNFKSVSASSNVSYTERRLVGIDDSKSEYTPSTRHSSYANIPAGHCLGIFSLNYGTPLVLPPPEAIKVSNDGKTSYTHSNGTNAPYPMIQTGEATIRVVNYARFNIDPNLTWPVSSNYAELVKRLTSGSVKMLIGPGEEGTSPSKGGVEFMYKNSGGYFWTNTITAAIGETILKQRILGRFGETPHS